MAVLYKSNKDYYSTYKYFSKLETNCTNFNLKKYIKIFVKNHLLNNLRKKAGFSLKKKEFCTTTIYYH